MRYLRFCPFVLVSFWLSFSCANVECPEGQTKIGTVCVPGKPDDAGAACASGSCDQDAGPVGGDASSSSDGALESHDACAAGSSAAGGSCPCSAGSVPTGPTRGCAPVDAGAPNSDHDARAADDSSLPPATDRDASPPGVDAQATASDDASVEAGAPGNNVLLDLAGRQPPSVIAAGSWPEQMRSGHWRFSWTPTFASTAMPNAYYNLFQFGAREEDSIWLERQDDVCKAWVTTASGVLLAQRPLVFSTNQTITYDIDLATGTWTITGASSGDGVLHNPAGGFTFPDGPLYVGTQPPPDDYDFSGTISNVEAVP